MNEERLEQLIAFLEKERGETYVRPSSYDDLFALYRGLVNMRYPDPVPLEILKIEDDMLQHEAKAKGIVTDSCFPEGLSLWQGDITRLGVDGIVNAANNQLLGCFHPGHHCIDNAIHTYAGMRLRLACYSLMQKQGALEQTGKAKITPGYNLPCRYVLHTVGPIVTKELTSKECLLLASCYESCLRLAELHGLRSLAFCCISTGVFHFPHDQAARIAIETVQNYLKKTGCQMKVIFNVFKEEDREIYRQLLSDQAWVKIS